MFVAKYLLIAVLALPALEIAVFILVAWAIGLGYAFLLLLGTSFIGWAVLRSAGGAHISRLRSAVGEVRVGLLEADADGVLLLLAGFLLFVPGFISDLVGLLLLIAPLRHFIGATVRRAIARQGDRREGVVELEPQEWKSVPQERLADRHIDRPEGPGER